MIILNNQHLSCVDHPKPNHIQTRTHTASLQTQSKAPDILSLRAYTEELLASLNAQAQAPDDPSKTLVSDSHLLSLHTYMEGSRPLLTPKTKLLMIFTPRIDSVFHVFSSRTLTIADQNF
jgi:hypothetical protein